MQRKPTARPRRRFASTALALALLAGCSGGIDLTGLAGGVDSGGTGSAIVVGPITGFGSIIVNGVRLDDSAATITDEDGLPRSRADLKLGVTTAVDASALTPDAGGLSGTATSIRIGSELVGPVDAVDAAAGTLTVLGQAVRVGATTVFDESLVGGLAGLGVGAVVEVYGQYDPAARRHVATRIEPAAGPALFKVRGAIDAIDPAAETMSIGGLLIDLGGLPDDALSGFAPGLIVRAKLRTASESGRWPAVSIAPAETRLPDREQAKVEGRVTAYVSSRQFSVDGIPVDASAAAFPDGEAAVTLSARVEVEGSAQGGVLRATVVEVEDDDSEESSFELHGTIDALDATARTFVVRGVTVGYDDAVVYEAGAVGDLAVGREVEVQAESSADGTRLQALKVSFKS